MKLAGSDRFRNIGFFLVLVIFCCAPVWAVGYFINQDGSAHLYSAHIMNRLLQNDTTFDEFYDFNSLSIPNSSGHWLMVLLLNVFSPFVVTKIVVTLTFAGLVAAVAWLRLRSAGVEGLKTSMLLGAALGFNWLWLCGFYNFLFGVGCFVFTVGLFFKWREHLTPLRTLVLSLLFLLAYFSHIISFLVLAGSVFLILAAADKNQRRRRLFCFFVALLPVIPLMIVYKSVSESGGGFFPVWRNLENPFSPVSWLLQLRTADPFILISRRSFPFAAGNSAFFALFTPILWITGALLALGAATIRQTERRNLISKPGLIFAPLFIICLLAALFAPDDFGLSNGSILRERLLICALIFFIPLFRAAKNLKLKRAAQACLAIVIVFQTAALWEYALKADSEARSFLAAQNAVNREDRTASIIVVENAARFNSTPLAMMNNYLGIEKNQLVLDNYEVGHYLFPVIAERSDDKRFVLELTQNNLISQNIQNGSGVSKLTRLDALFAADAGKIDALIVWGRDPQVEEFIRRWFAEKPVYENREVRVFRRKL